jgi:hypothetical protein
MTRKQLYMIIFELDTKPGKLSNIALLWLILLSVNIAIVENIPEIIINSSPYFS